jgi:radical SAM protein (TIGR01212 family)
MNAVINWSKGNSLAKDQSPAKHAFNPQVPYNNYGAYLKARYGKKVYRIGLDGGFSCPNRGSDRHNPGCSFCPGDGAKSPYAQPQLGLTEQIQNSLTELRYKPGSPAILYFQAYTSTSGPLGEFRAKLQEALEAADFQEVIFSTRPDCLEAPVLDTIRELVPGHMDVWIELGLQSALDCTLDRINRGHGWQEFERAAWRVKDYGFKLAAHIILGLPGEGRLEWLQTLEKLLPLPLDGIKIHNLLVIKGTPLWREWEEGRVNTHSRDDHKEACIELLTKMPPHWLILRLTTDWPGPSSDLAWELGDKQSFLVDLRKTMVEGGLFQGIYYQDSSKTPL